MGNLQLVSIEIGPGEAVDRMCILALKTTRLDGDKRGRALADYGLLLERVSVKWRNHATATELMDVNEQLWELEDAVRSKLRAREQDREFAAIAARIPQLNDKRAALKAELDKAFGFAPCEVKHYVGG